ncbi:MAG: DUF4013 domain-containing protein [Puniceicoccales bacterium]|jgi:hypothetical protein|nr:DUF4013 domain-containing protein [Puniceicoccales bacterium]
MKNVLFPRFTDDRLWLKTAIGVLFMFIPPLLLFAFGYLYRFMRTPRYATDGGVQLPEWSNWWQLLWDGVRFAAFFTTYAVICVILALVAKWLIYVGSFSVLNLPMWLFLPLPMALLFPGFFTCLMLYQRRERLGDLFAPSAFAHYLRRIWWPMIWPSLAFVGLQFVCCFLYGITWFVGFGVAIASFNELLRHYGDRIDEVDWGYSSVAQGSGSAVRRGKR